ncbi:hypothetical protein PV797_16875 [Clostridiaceae bacterium M8S5]|nr:hypothetical protein PV797_16875 [Clostridiaceae bacterium M8S5]
MKKSIGKLSLFVLLMCLIVLNVGNINATTGMNDTNYSMKSMYNTTTGIDAKVKELNKDNSLPTWIQESFANSNYRTVEATQDIIVYRAFGGTAKANGGFVTTFNSNNKQEIMDKLALLPEWGNTMDYVATIKIPKGTVLNIGKVAPQTSQNGQRLNGGADQILMPLNWPNSWIVNISPLN